MGKNLLSSIQWAVFILAGSIITPISVAAAFHFSPEETSALLQRTFFLVGATSLLQGLFGHKLPLMEGPAGLWWGVFLTYAGVAISSHSSIQGTLTSLELGLLASGLLFILLSCFNLIKYVRKLFTPTITGIYLVLLTIQLSGPFIQGILGIEGNKMNWKVMLAAVLTLLLSIVFSRSKSRFLQNYSILLSLAIGWILYNLFGLKTNAPHVSQVFALPKIFVWGWPTFNLSIFITALLTTFLLLTNLLASVDAVKEVTHSNKKINLNMTGFVMGINQIIAGLFSAVGGVAISGSAGFILTTRIKERLPFLVGSAIILVMSFFPIVMNIFASLPDSIGYGTMFISMASIAGLGFKTFKASVNNESKVTVMSIAFMAGAGMMLIPSGALNMLPSTVSSLLTNGLVIGVIIAIILEQLFKEKKPEKLSDQIGVK
ncbi:purine/pyrimidine permease [Scopulibacillus cellulosilyticus]|uniref:Purine/pyrimidine permease n=1 Tax=Scopulibacillus cellulosilyticus TaxID=2665665 RepID=A0ABW2PR50_9BACL